MMRLDQEIQEHLYGTKIVPGADPRLAAERKLGKFTDHQLRCL